LQDAGGGKVHSHSFKQRSGTTSDLYQHGSYTGGQLSLDWYHYDETDAGTMTFHGEGTETYVVGLGGSGHYFLGESVSKHVFTDQTRRRGGSASRP
jgi:hypothetical protein